MRGVLTKLEIVEGKLSMVKAGYNVLGDLYRVRKTEEGYEKIELKNLSEIEVDDMVISDGDTVYNFLKTSPISELILKSDKEIEFKTTTSLYRLETV